MICLFVFMAFVAYSYWVAPSKTFIICCGLTCIFAIYKLSTDGDYPVTDDNPGGVAVTWGFVTMPLWAPPVYWLLAGLGMLAKLLFPA